MAGDHYAFADELATAVMLSANIVGERRSKY
jgi:hypothetical protein